MNENSRNKNNEEIDLGDLFRLVKKGFEKLGKLLLRFIGFLLRNAIVLIILIIIGAVAGYFLQKKASNVVKTEMIVASDFGSAEYLFKSVKELQYKLKIKDKATIEKLGLEGTKASISLAVKPIIDLDELTREEENYLELLNESDFLEKEEKEGLMKKISRFYEIILYHPHDLDSRKLLKNVIEILRDNDYYRKVYALNSKKIDFLIKADESLISQMDSLMVNYSNSLKNTPLNSSTIYNTNSALDLGVMIGNRTSLVEELDGLYKKKVANEELFRLVDLGYPSEIEEKSITSYKIILIPLLLVLAYFGLIIFVRVVQKAKKLDR